MSNNAEQPRVVPEDDDEPDEWDKRIFSTGCHTEQDKMNDCYFAKKDWRACKDEMEAFRECWKRQAYAVVPGGHWNLSSRYPASPKPRVPNYQPNTSPKASVPSARATTAQTAHPHHPQLPNRLPQYPHAQQHLTPPPHNPSPLPPQPRAAKQQTTSPRAGYTINPLDVISAAEEKIDWTRSFHGLSAEPFPEKAANILLAEIDPHQVEIKPDGIVYLPEIKYRRVLNQAFGPGAWGLVPRSESIVTPKTVTREYALVCHGRLVFFPCQLLITMYMDMRFHEHQLTLFSRLVSVARGEQDYFSPDGIPTATEGCRSNALVRCCKDLGIASELWDPRWIRMYKAKYAREVFVEHIVSKKKSKIWVRKDDAVSYPWKENK
ncbi:Mitochondrial genome maintenance protein [Penicillium verhagenii]|nr:Mitochondrial genome maintenance protein [Penicillium verhagenii]